MTSPGYETPPAWAAAEARDAARKAERARELGDAAPVRVVDVRLSFSTTCVLVVQIAIAQALIGGAILIALALLDIL